MHLENQKPYSHAGETNSGIKIVLDDNLLFNCSINLFKEYADVLNPSHTNIAQTTEQLQQLLKQYADEPTFVSRIASVYRSINNDEFADQIVRDNYRKFPFSLFARCDYAYLCLKENHLKEAAATVDYTFNLMRLYPNKSVFHLLEVMEFQEFLVTYFCTIKDFERAVGTLNALQLLTKKSPLTRSLRSMIVAKILESNLSSKSLEILFQDEKDEEISEKDNKNEL